MRLYLVLPILALATTIGCSEQNSNSFATDNVQSIIGGHAVSAEHKIAKTTVKILIVYLRADNSKRSGICTGSIVGTKSIITAAHCFDAPEENLTFKGAFVSFNIDASNVDPATSQWTSSFKVHPNYRKDDGTYDVAVIKLSGPIPPKYHATRINTQEDIDDIKQVVVAGFGREDESERQHSKTLKFDILDVGPKMDTWSILMIQDNYSGVCFGDSGGPVFSKDNNDKLSLIGLIVSVIGIDGKFCNDKAYALQLSTVLPFLNQEIQ